MRSRYFVSRRPGFALNLFNFILTTVGTTALATASIIAAYQKFIVEPRRPSEVAQLRQEISELQIDRSGPARLGSERDNLLHERNLFEAAAAIEESKLPHPAGLKVPDTIRYRGMTPEQVAEARHLEHVASAEAIVSAAIDDPHARPDFLDPQRVNELLADLNAVKNEPANAPIRPPPPVAPEAGDAGFDHGAAP